jgi:UDPglucose 6-dehydrogenase
MVIAGVEDDDVFDAFLDVSMSYVNADETPYHYLSYVDAEVAKIAVNTYLTMKINFANTVGEVCEGLPNGDAHQVLEAVGSDSRIGDKYLKVGGTPSGVCLPRDSKAFAALADSVGAKAPLAIATDEISTRTVSRISDMLGDYDNVAILGMTYKPDTAIITESLGLRLMHDLATEFCSVAVYDPIADLSSLVSDVTVAPSAEAAIKLSEAVVICTPLEEFSDLDFGGRFVIDVWNIAKSQPNVRRLGVAGRWEWVT